MLQDMNAHPWMLLKNARSLAELQVRINQLSISGLQSYKDGLMHTIRRAPHLGDNLREKALNLLATLTDREKLCHGDFHPGNVLITDSNTFANYAVETG
jgi:Ser/Thr protein kinase RdoA (MazF antagonist)